MVKNWSLINDIKLIIMVFFLSFVYSFLLNGKFNMDISINLIYLLTCCIYISSLVVLLQINSIYVNNIYKYVSVCFASIGMISMTYLLFSYGNFDFVNQELWMTKMFYVFSIYEVVLLIFCFYNIDRDIGVKKLTFIILPVTFFVAFIGINKNIGMTVEQNVINGFLCRSLTIALYIILYALINNNKEKLSEGSFKAFKLYVAFRVGIEIFTIISVNQSYNFRYSVGYILKFLGNYCIFKIMIIEVIRNPHKAIYDKLIKKSLDLEKYVEELERRDKEDDIKNQLLSNISHEFKTPVNVIYSAIQMQNLKKENNNVEEILKFNNIIKQNCHRLIRLINNFIDSSKLKGGEYNIDLKCANVVEIVESTTMSILSYAESMDIKVIFDTDAEEIYSLVDRDLIERVMLNLLSNAIKYNKPCGSIFVDIKSCDDKIKIKVEDSGIGIPKEKQEVIFNRFERVDKTLSRHKEGSGLGLNIVKEIILKHKGMICIDSKPGVGTIAIISLRRVEYDETLVELDNLNAEIGNGIKEKVKVEMSDIYL